MHVIYTHYYISYICTNIIKQHYIWLYILHTYRHISIYYKLNYLNIKSYTFVYCKHSLFHFLSFFFSIFYVGGGGGPLVHRLGNRAHPVDFYRKISCTRVLSLPLKEWEQIAYNTLTVTATLRIIHQIHKKRCALCYAYNLYSLQNSTPVIHRGADPNRFE